MVNITCQFPICQYYFVNFLLVNITLSISYWSILLRRFPIDQYYFVDFLLVNITSSISYWSILLRRFPLGPFAWSFKQMKVDNFLLQVFSFLKYLCWQIANRNKGIAELFVYYIILGFINSYINWYANLIKKMLNILNIC